MKVGFIGLGTMGSSMALNTLKGGMNLSSMILTVMLLRRTSKGALAGRIHRVQLLPPVRSC